MSCWSWKQNADRRHDQQAAKTCRVLLLARARARPHKPVYGWLAEPAALQHAAGVSAWPFHRRGRTDLLPQAPVGIHPPSILPLASADERSPAPHAIPTAL